MSLSLYTHVVFTLSIRRHWTRYERNRVKISSDMNSQKSLRMPCHADLKTIMQNNEIVCSPCLCENPNDISSLTWRRNGHGGVSNHQPHHCLLNRLFGCKSKKTSKLRVTGLCAGNSQGTGEFPAQMASNAENVSIWSRHHVCEY